MRRIILLLLIVFLVALVAQAQDTDAPPAEREIITVLQMGDGVFENDLWRASAAETASSTTATWLPIPESGYGAISHIAYLHVDDGYTPTGLDELFNDQWFADTLANWEDVRKTNVCFDGDITLHEFSLAFRDANDNVTQYDLRYWVDPVSETRVRTWHIAFATTFSDGAPNPKSAAWLDDYARRMYPDLPACR
jgi:hypothetical protein